MEGRTLEREALVLERAVECYGPGEVTAMALDALGGLVQGLSGYLHWTVAGDDDPEQMTEQLREHIARASVILGLLEMTFGPTAEEEEYQLLRLEKRVGRIKAVTKNPAPEPEKPQEQKNVDLLLWLCRDDVKELAREKTGEQFHGVVVKALQGIYDPNDSRAKPTGKPAGKPITVKQETPKRRGRRKKEAVSDETV